MGRIATAQRDGEMVFVERSYRISNQVLVLFWAQGGLLREEPWVRASLLAGAGS